MNKPDTQTLIGDNVDDKYTIIDNSEDDTILIITPDIWSLFEIQDYTDDEWEEYQNVYGEYYENKTNTVQDCDLRDKI